MISLQRSICIAWFTAVASVLLAAESLPRERSFDSDWRFIREDAAKADQAIFDDSTWRALDVPHDWSIEDLPPLSVNALAGGDTNDLSQRIGPFDPARSEGGPSTGHMIGGIGWYRKHFTLSPSDAEKIVIVRFDGVYMNASVWINGNPLGNHPYGYTSFSFDLTPFLKPPGQENVLAVQVKNLGKNSRWYSGSGIFRHVWLIATDPVRVPQWGIQIVTPSVSKISATVNVTTTIQNGRSAEAPLRLRTRLISPAGKTVATQETQIRVLGEKRQENTHIFSVPQPALWSLSSPSLYRAEVEVVDNGKIIDHADTTFGIRSLQFNPTKGFLINGEMVKLKGGCMHHDNGPLGSATIDRAEERRVELMKACGFNAIRTSHNPPSPAFLDACDRLGVVVIDEAFDMWEAAKNPEDYHLYFKDWWKRDLESMVLRDRNHPSVIIWSLGNEIHERAEPSGLTIGRNLAQAVRRLDSTRPVTAAICEFRDEPGKKWTDNVPAFISLGVGGYNYQWRQYTLDHKTFPLRMMAGTASYPKDAFESWQAALTNSWVIGDFVWAAWDYLGESGIGHASIDNEMDDFFKPWPWFNAWCGDIDVCGFKKPQHYYRDVVWGTTNIAIAVHAPLPPGRAEKTSAWGWPDEQQSWTWPGQDGNLMDVAVYSSCETVRLELNGKVIGVKPVSNETKLTARFQVPYAPGVLGATGLVDGKARGSVVLRTAGAPKKLRLIADRTKIRPDRSDLAYVTLEVLDNAGSVVPNATLPVRFAVSGEGELAATGSGNPSDAASFRAPLRATFRGRCLAILRPKGAPGAITLRAEADGLIPTSVTIKTK